MLFAVFAILMLAAVTSCGKKTPDDSPNNLTDPSASKSDGALTPAPVIASEPAEDLMGKAIDPLTGFWIDQDTAASRPIAVVFNNHHKALPQSGIGQAAVYYEVLAEGNITRIVGIFHGLDAVKLGPIRSARHYFIDFALDYDAIFIHHGGSPQGYSTLFSLQIPYLDGLALEGVTFWRDPERVKISGMYEHSSYTDAEKIQAAIASYGYRAELEESPRIGFDFYPENTPPAGATGATGATDITGAADAVGTADITGAAGAETLEVQYSEDYQSTFVYDGKDKVYYKFHEGEPHIDAETGEQLSVANILIQFTSISDIQNDDAGRRDVKTVGVGTGFLITCGGVAPVTWEKYSHQSPTQWRWEDGSEIQLNKGKTWICVISPDTPLEIK
jgi:hypothetical protein